MKHEAQERSIVIAAALVAAAAALPYLSTLNNYFVRDDFGVVEHFASTPVSNFWRWFYSPWTDGIWGYVPDEVRPFPAVSYQLTALGGAASPFLHHTFNIALHAANGLLVLAIARVVAGLSLPAAAFGAAVFVLLPVQTESVAWITGRVDSMPALFYLASFLAYVLWRKRGTMPTYALSLILFFLALFTKQTTITMTATLVAWDVLCGDRPLRITWAWLRPYGPFVVMTLGFLALRYVLFGEVAREGQLNAEGLRGFVRLVEGHLNYVVTGRVQAAALVTWGVIVALAVIAALLLHDVSADERRSRLAMLVYFGPVWWAVGVAPIVVAGYDSPRHVYLASVGWAIALAIVLQLVRDARHASVWRQASTVCAALVVVVYAAELRVAVAEWNTMAAVSHKAVIDTRAEALSAPPGSLLILGAPVRSWEWALPFSVRPPYTRTDLRSRVMIMSPWLLHCCRDQWFEDTRATLRAWQAHPAGSIVVLRWESDSGALSRLSDREYPALRSLIPVLLEVKTRDALAAAVLRIVNELPALPHAQPVNR